MHVRARARSIDTDRRSRDSPISFTTVWISDHLQFGDDPLSEAWTLLTYLAATFPRFRYGHLVLCQSYRNPAVLAKMAATLQELTGGRFVLGLGAGWHEEEYRAYNVDYPRPGIRVQQLAETIEIARAMWTQSPATFTGEHYRIEGAYCEPRPDPPIPILVGTNGPKAIAVAARLADSWCWDGPWDETYQRATRHPARRLRGHRPAVRGDRAPRRADDRAARRSRRHSSPPTSTRSTRVRSFRIAGPTPGDVAREIETLVDHRRDAHRHQRRHLGRRSGASSTRWFPVVRLTPA